VFLLQTADLYDIRQIIRLARESKDWNDKLVDCRKYVTRGLEFSLYLCVCVCVCVCCAVVRAKTCIHRVATAWWTFPKWCGSTSSRP